MSLKTKMSTATIVALIAVGAFLYSTSGEGNSATVVVSWTPSPREPHGVEVRVAVGGKPAAKEMPKAASWIRAFPLKRGERIDVWASLLGPGDGFLGCSITINGIPEYEKGGNTSPGKVLHCWGQG